MGNDSHYVLIGALVFIAAGTVHAQSTSVYRAEGGAVILHRASPDSLVFLRDDTTGEPIANADNFEFPWKGGVDVSLARRWGHGEFEVRYFGVDDWLSHRAIDISQNVDNGEQPVFVNSAAADYTSQLHSTEINWREPLTRDIDWLVGFRWVELHEVLTISAEVDDPEFPVPVLVSLPFRTSNYLYGAQVGADAKLWDVGGPLSIDAAIKAGLFGNHADSEFAIRFFDFTLGSVQAEGSHASFLGEIDVAGVYRLTEHLALRGGYQVIWVTGVALPPEQLANFLEERSGIDIEGTVFYHGATVGVECNW